MKGGVLRALLHNAPSATRNVKHTLDLWRPTVVQRKVGCFAQRSAGEEFVVIFNNHYRHNFSRLPSRKEGGGMIGPL